jgi:DNA (cytosine-5)-methyltransferase 1
MAVENDKDSVHTLKENNKGLKVYDGCIKRFNDNFDEIAYALGRIDHIHFSSPCQDFSTANRSMNDSTESMLPRHRADLSLLLVDLVRKTSCDTAVFENVVGIWSRRSCRYLHTITKEIIKLGYQVQCTVLRACDFGDPQKRPRFFMFIAKNNVALPQIPPATHGDEMNLWPYVTVKDALYRIRNPS